jgi:nicotinate-nucleotide adenylyltransferase
VSSRPRLGVLGGTFDPIHRGHVLAAQEALRQLALDQVVFVPAGRPWQKEDRDLTDAADRLEMVRLATADEPRFTISLVDIDRAGPTYTVDTLRDLRATRPDHDLFFIVGADALASIPSWHNAEQCLRLATFVGCTRPGHALQYPDLPQERISMIEFPGLDISSTEIRDRARAGLPVDDLVPARVSEFITNRGLYRENGAS